MAWYDRFIKSNKGPEVIEGYQSFSTPFLPVGRGNLTLPVVDPRYNANMWQYFGTDNLYPELLNQMYFSSPLHGAIVDFKTNAVIGGGFNLTTDKLTPQEKLEMFTFEKKANLKHTVKAVTKQLILHNRVYFKLYFGENRKLIKIENVSPEKVRVGRDKKMYFLCDDWSRRIGIEEIKPYHMIKETIDRLKGAANAGKAVAFFANSADQLPKIESLPTNGNDKLFHEASALNTEQICFSHTIDPILMGIRTTGALGSGSDIKQAYVIFEKNVVMELRQQVVTIFQELLTIARIPAEFTINNFQIIGDTIIEVDEDTAKVKDALNNLSDALLGKVLEKMTTNEIRALASLPPIDEPTQPIV